MAYTLTKKTKNYRVDFRFAWNGWLANLSDYFFTNSIGVELQEYWDHLWAIIKDVYGVHYETSSSIELAEFFIRTRLIVIVVFRENITQKQAYNIKYYVKHKILNQSTIDWMIEQLKMGW